MSKTGFRKRPVRPSHAELVSLATYFFPPCGSLKVVVCDFGAGRFERFEAELEFVQRYKSLFRSQCDYLTLGYCIRLGGETHVGDYTVDVSFPNLKVLYETDIRRHIPVGSGLVQSVSQFFVFRSCYTPELPGRITQLKAASFSEPRGTLQS